MYWLKAQGNKKRLKADGGRRKAWILRPSAVSPQPSAIYLNPGSVARQPRLTLKTNCIKNASLIILAHGFDEILINTIT